MPRLWNETIEAHRREVGDAIIETTAALVADHGLRGVTMSRIAEDTGIGRATLYKYFPDVDAILLAWHERQVTRHLDDLAALRDAAGDPGERLAAVLRGYALITRQGSRQNHGTDLTALLHRGAHIDRAERQLGRLVQDLIAEGAAAGLVRDDVAPEELASYCLHALGAAAGATSHAAVSRLVTVTLAGLRPATATT